MAPPLPTPTPLPPGAPVPTPTPTVVALATPTAAVSPLTLTPTPTPLPPGVPTPTPTATPFERFRIPFEGAPGLGLLIMAVIGAGALAIVVVSGLRGRT